MFCHALAQERNAAIGGGFLLGRGVGCLDVLLRGVEVLSEHPRWVDDKFARGELAHTVFILGRPCVFLACVLRNAVGFLTLESLIAQIGVKAVFENAEIGDLLLRQGLHRVGGEDACQHASKGGFVKRVFGALNEACLLACRTFTECPRSESLDRLATGIGLALGRDYLTDVGVCLILEDEIVGGYGRRDLENFWVGFIFKGKILHGGERVGKLDL